MKKLIFIFLVLNFYFNHTADVNIRLQSPYLQELKKANNNDKYAQANLSQFNAKFALSNDRSWYPYLKTAIDQLLSSAKSYIKLSKIFNNQRLLAEAAINISSIKFYKSELTDEDRQTINDEIEKLKSEIN